MENNKPTIEQIENYKRLSCSGKKAYASKNWAKRAAKSVKRNHNDDVKAYRCVFCNEFHLGHRNQYAPKYVTRLNFNPWKSVN